ncbi:MAG: EamA family transporter [Nitrososphaerales archaeon]
MATNDIFGIALALASAISFAGSTSVLSRPLTKSDPSSANFLGLVVGTAIAATVTLTFGQAGSLASISLTAIAIFAIVGLFHFNISRLLNFTAVKNIGANQTAPITATQIPYSVLFAVFLLGEKITFPIIIGVGLIIFGVTLLRAGAGANIRGGNAKAGYLAAASTGLIWGFTPILINLGLAYFHYFMAATFLAYSVALLSYLPVAIAKHSTAKIRELPRITTYAYILSGALLVVAQLLRFGALSYAPVITVVPMLSIFPIFIIIFTWMIAKDIEIFQRKTILSIVLTTIGTILVSVF